MKSKLLDDSQITRIVEEALAEDIGSGDITTLATVPPNSRGVGKFIAKQNGIVAGMEVVDLVYTYVDEGLSFLPKIQDGSSVEAGDLIGVVAGHVRSILSGERVALNFLQRMSGIATLTAKFVEAIADVNQGKTKILDTRKTVPGLRVFDKWAVRLGGGVNHRYGLDSMVLIKDNHVVASGGVREAIERCRKYLAERDLHVKIEVEVQNLDELKEVLDCGGVDFVMLDNFDLEDMKKAVEMVQGRVKVEASGGVTLETVRAVAKSGVDFISIGALTHSVKALDISLEVEI
jgi:nicotinate-nucleotide pyrophosphorylase (carboxylating)